MELDDNHYILIAIVIVLLYLWGYPKYLASKDKCYDSCEKDYKDCSGGCASENYTDAELREHYDDKRDARGPGTENIERHFSKATLGDLDAELDFEPEDVDGLEARAMNPEEESDEHFVDDNEARIIADGLDKGVIESHDQYLSDNMKYILSNNTRHSMTSHREDAGVSWVGRPPTKGRFARTPGGPTMIHSNYEDQISGNKGRAYSAY